MAGALLVPFILSRAPLPGVPCLIRLQFGVPCPGCGMTRSWVALCRGDFLTSFRFHPFGPPLFLLALVLLLTALPAPAIAPLHARIKRSLRSPVLMKPVAALFLGVWVLRLYLAHVGNAFFLW